MFNRKRLVLFCMPIAALTLISALAVAQTNPPAAGEDKLRELPAETPGATGDPDKGDQTEAGEQSKQSKEEAPPQPWWRANMIFLLMIGAFILLYLWMGRGRRRQEAKRKEMLANLKKGDKVTSIGGIIGTVIEVREDEVTVKVDETSNVRMKFLRRAIQAAGEEATLEARARK